jgi:hypothetical protein
MSQEQLPSDELQKEVAMRSQTVSINYTLPANVNAGI